MDCQLYWYDANMIKNGEKKNKIFNLIVSVPIGTFLFNSRQMVALLVIIDRFEKLLASQAERLLHFMANGQLTSSN
ncbi:hypothetical protein QQG55_31870 [Brugia pahangi]